MVVQSRLRSILLRPASVDNDARIHLPIYHVIQSTTPRCYYFRIWSLESFIQFGWTTKKRWNIRLAWNCITISRSLCKDNSNVQYSAAIESAVAAAAVVVDEDDAGAGATAAAAIMAGHCPMPCYAAGCRPCVFIKYRAAWNDLRRHECSEYCSYSNRPQPCKSREEDKSRPMSQPRGGLSSKTSYNGYSNCIVVLSADST